MECVCEGLEMLLSVPPLPDRCCSKERLDDPSWGSGLADERQEQLVYRSLGNKIKRLKRPKYTQALQRQGLSEIWAVVG